MYFCFLNIYNVDIHTQWNIFFKSLHYNYSYICFLKKIKNSSNLNSIYRLKDSEARVPNTGYIGQLWYYTRLK